MLVLAAVKSVAELSLSPTRARGCGGINTCRSCSQPGPALRPRVLPAQPIATSHAVTSPPRQPTRRPAPFQLFLKVAAPVRIAGHCKTSGQREPERSGGEAPVRWSVPASSSAELVLAACCTPGSPPAAPSPDPLPDYPRAAPHPSAAPLPSCLRQAALTSSFNSRRGANPWLSPGEARHYVRSRQGQEGREEPDMPLKQRDRGGGPVPLIFAYRQQSIPGVGGDLSCPVMRVGLPDPPAPLPPNLAPTGCGVTLGTGEM
ncbi:hypothetical protein E2C01_053036 [Portunus trituberculatus]|uniref:Uncharacterized protein n=1 Tax=Portunus trituberculatus TaxID=210409 RepID=A0A5B7GJ96_PORTR|nr:hypothetical protein [Portunus trituberculatus]